jgi:4-hydroxybenzoate polyprenyltransferase
MVFGLLLIYFIYDQALLITLLYILISLSYTIKLKYLKYFDLGSIVSLFLIRLLLGSIVIDIYLSNSLILFVSFTCLGIVLGKKISIYKDNKIISSDVKSFLKKSYSLKNLEISMQVSLFLSTITYINWVFGNESFMFLDYKIYLLILSCIFYAIIMVLFLKKTLKGETEDISQNLLNFDIFTFIAFLFGVTFLVGSF